MHLIKCVYSSNLSSKLRVYTQYLIGFYCKKTVMKGPFAIYAVNLLMHPITQALVIAVLICLLLPDFFQKYTIRPVNEIILKGDNIREYHDIDQDGNSEIINSGNADNRAFLTVFNQFGVVDQWNFDGNYAPDGKRYALGDYNNDGIKEIFPLVARNDSLFINGIDIRQTGKLMFSERFLVELPTSGTNLFAVFSPQLADLTGDGIKEVVCVNSAGFGLVPRRVVAYDIQHDHVFTSVELGAFCSDLQIDDLDADGRPELCVSNYASANYKDTLDIMHDHAAYLIVLNHDLSFRFAPIKFSGDYASCQAFPVKTNQGTRLVTIIRYEGQDNKPDLLLQIRDAGGEVLEEKILENSSEYCQTIMNFQTIHGLSRMCVIKNDQTVSLLDGELDLLGSTRLYTNNILPVQFTDADQDGELELLLSGNKPGQFVILRQNLQHPVSFITLPTSSPATPSNILRNNLPPQLGIQVNNRFYTYEYAFNPMVYWRYPIYLLVYSLVFAFILLIRRIQYIQLRKKYETERKLTEMQLISLQNQMDPHFTFNVLNTIGSVILQNKSQQSYDMLMKFSKMIRATIHSADKICRSLKEELDFMQNYIELQQSRYGEAFTFNLDVADDIDKTQNVPKMVVQTYVENALKHGLLPKENGGGFIQVKVRHGDEGLEISIIDNGVGRKQAKNNGSSSTGVGLSIMKQYYSVLNNGNKRPITETFVDQYDADGNASGTRVTICIPDGFVFP